MKNLLVFRRLLALALAVSFWVELPNSSLAVEKKTPDKELTLDNSSESDELSLDTTKPRTKVEILSPAAKAFDEKAYQRVLDLLTPRFSKLQLSEYILLGRAYDGLGNAEAARKVFNAGLEKFPGNLDLKSRLGESILHGIRNFLAEKEKYREGLQLLKEVIEKDPGNSLAHSILIEVYEKRDNKYELRLIYEDLIAIHGEKFEYVSKLCSLYLQTSLFEQSEKFCRLGIKLKSSDPACYVNLGLTLKAVGKSDAAERELKTAALSFSKSEIAQVSYAEFLEEKKKYIEAFKYFSLTLKINPEAKHALLGIAHTGIESHNYAESLTAFKKICTLYPKDSRTPFRRAITNFRQEKNLEWEKKFEDGLESCP